MTIKLLKMQGKKNGKNCGLPKPDKKKKLWQLSCQKCREEKNKKNCGLPKLEKKKKNIMAIELPKM